MHKEKQSEADELKTRKPLNKHGRIPRISRRRFVQSTAVGAGATLFPTGSAYAQTEQQLSQASDEFVLKDDLMVEMRDGTRLSTDVYLPSTTGTPFPTLLSRTPYNKEGYTETARFFTQEGYAVVVQDVRGKFESEGVFYPYRSEGNAEAKDGYDTVEWAAAQEWSNGKVGTFGISYLAGTQWAIAHNDQLPPHLEAMAPGFAAASYYGQGAYAGGAVLLSHDHDYLNTFAIERYNREHPDLDDEFTFLEKAQEAMPQLFWDLPVDPYQPMERAGYPWLSEWYGHETYGDFWAVQDHTLHYDKIDIPVLNYGGWYDIFTEGTVWNYRGISEKGASTAQEQTALIMGPYTHGDTALRAQGQVAGHAYRFPENATYDSLELVLNWFDRHLKGESSDSTSAGPQPVRLYIPGGLNDWIGASAFPLPQTEFTKFYLHSSGDANVRELSDTAYEYDGRLTTQPPSGTESPDEYTYDPSNPLVGVGGYNTHWNGGVADRATAYHNRDDILVYETPILTDDMAIVGPITVTLYASTSAVDTDFVVVLSDVNPTARPGGIWIAEGARRGRIGDVEGDPRVQETFATWELLDPGTVYAWKIAVWPTGRVFEKGHRLRIDISSSNFPRYSRNLNTGEGLDSSEMVCADQTVYHDTDHPSNIELPLIPMSDLEDMVIDGPIPESQ